MQSTHRRALGKAAAKEAQEVFLDVIHENCSGCKDNLENQLGHELCCMADFQEQVNYCFPLLIEKIETDKLQPEGNIIPKDQLLNDKDWMELTS